MKKFLSLIVVVIALASFGCNSGSTEKKFNGQHEVVAQEVLQTTQYTYIKVKEGDTETWLAVPKMEVKEGETYYYVNGLKMTDFASKELNRTFPEVLFLDKVSTTPIPADQLAQPTTAAPDGAAGMDPGMAHGGMATAAETAAPADSQRTQVETHVLVAKEVKQTTQYTYIRGDENGKEVWVAVNKVEANVGTKYYFIGVLPMTNFASKELNRTFKEILFADNISTTPPGSANGEEVTTQNPKVVSTGSAIPIEKDKVAIQHGKGELTIGELWADPKKYAGKTVLLKGKVVKFTPGIMKKNWIHLQDGTENKGKFDLVITTDQELKVGDVVKLEGLISADKDFGFGYYYQLLMEDAKVRP